VSAHDDDPKRQIRYALLLAEISVHRQQRAEAGAGD